VLDQSHMIDRTLRALPTNKETTKPITYGIRHYNGLCQYLYWVVGTKLARQLIA